MNNDLISKSALLKEIQDNYDCNYGETLIDPYVDNDGKWHDYCLVYYYHDYREFEVIAWQPLPEGYKGE